MKRIRTMGLCLVAMFAFSAMVVSVAQAGQVGICARTARTGKMFKGAYLEKNCLKAASKEEVEKGGTTNRYEWTSAAGHKYTAKGPTVHLRMPETIVNGLEAEVRCKSSTGAGEWTGNTTGVDTIVFKRCTLNGTHGQCTSEGLSAGDIETSPLDVTLVTYPETREQQRLNEETHVVEFSPVGPAEERAWLEYSAAPGHAYTEYVCEPDVMVRTLGTLAGLVIGHTASPFNAMRQMVQTSFGPGIGVQDLNAEFSDNGGMSWEPTGFDFVSNNSKVFGAGKFEIKP
jgi:hypothetical protein